MEDKDQSYIKGVELENLELKNQLECLKAGVSEKNIRNWDTRKIDITLITARRLQIVGFHAARRLVT